MTHQNNSDTNGVPVQFTEALTSIYGEIIFYKVGQSFLVAKIKFSVFETSNV